ncbi:rust resistance kinase Lr10-like [Apium graveolens]|uniref:rust resistance kinase Lr10-like n=1 Tax=Apium graveolens TaxID=4045 RepID=UPI003D796D42
MVILNEFMLLVLVSCIISKLGVAVFQDDECSVTRCLGGDSKIRFPFHLIDSDKEKQPRSDHCGFPVGFELSCGTIDQYNYPSYSYYPMVKFEYQVSTSLPGLYLSFSVEAYVDSIDYKSRQLHFISKSTNFTHHYDYYLSNSPFKPFTFSGVQEYNTLKTQTDFTFYNCSSTNNEVYIYGADIPSLSGHGFKVYAIHSHSGITEVYLTSCTKLYNISHIPFYEGGLSWSEPNCGDCEAKEQYCKFKPNSTTITQCFPIPKGPPSNKLLVTGKVGGIFVLSFLLVAFCYAIYSYKQKKTYQQKIEMFLEDYKSLKPTRYSYADIKKISNHFTVKLGEGGYGSVFKGQLSNDVAVAVKVLNDKVDAKGSGEDFINEVSTIGLIHHVNVVRLVGYCADGCRRALVYEFQPNNSLEKHVYSGENHSEGFLGWEKMQDISLGIAKGIEYLHQGCAQRILHFDIKPHNILLDQNFNPKVSDFGLAKLCNKGQSIVSMTMARGTIGYIAPEVFSRNFGEVSSKSDVYSFGMLLLEIVGARNHISIGTENASEVYFPEWIFHQLEQRNNTTTTTTSLIEEDLESMIQRKLTVVGLWCVNWHPADRPSMKRVIQMLQAEHCPAIPPNPFKSTSSRNAFAGVPARLFTSELEVIAESE